MNHNWNIAIIVCHTLNGVIGNKGGMPWHLPKDLQRFKRITLKHPIVMGSKTFRALPNQKPLPGRQNIVLSRSGFTSEGCVIIKSLNDLYALVGEQLFFVIGGRQIYEIFLPYAKRIYRTVIETHINGDTYFPDIKPSQWKIMQKELSPADSDNPYAMRFEVLERTQPHST